MNLFEDWKQKLSLLESQTKQVRDLEVEVVIAQVDPHSRSSQVDKLEAELATSEHEPTSRDLVVEDLRSDLANI